MTNVKALTAALILSAAIATPAFAHSSKHSHVRDQTNFRGAYNQFVVPFSGRDPSPVGGGNSSLHPGDINPSGS
jgi:hypothetical protein